VLRVWYAANDESPAATIAAPAFTPEVLSHWPKEFPYKTIVGLALLVTLYDVVKPSSPVEPDAYPLVIFISVAIDDVLAPFAGAVACANDFSKYRWHNCNSVPYGLQSNGVA
jgi:hypothetical protein